jgi:hypothetical protein
MNQKNKPIRLSMRLPEPLCGLVHDEAARRFCSASDVVRLSLIDFFGLNRQTKHDETGKQLTEEVRA